MENLKNIHRIFFVFVVLFVVTISGCSSSSKGENYFDAEGKGELLVSTVLSVDSVKDYNLCCMAIEDKLIQYLAGDKYSYSVYNIKGDSLLYDGKFILEGNGPYEMSIPEIKYRPDKNELIIYSDDTFENDFYKIDLTNFSNLYDTRLWKRGKLPMLPTRDGFEFVNDSVYLHTSYTKKNSLFSISYKGMDNYCVSLNLPYPLDKKEPDLILEYSLFFGDLVKHPQKSKFLYSCEFFKYAIVFDLEDDEIKNVHYISRVLPDYKPILDNPYQLFKLNKKSQEGFIDIIVTTNYIYIGYNNMILSDIWNDVPFKGYPVGFFDHISMFDWDGNFIKRLVLDKPIHRFSVSQDDYYLYASSVDLMQEEQPNQVLRFMLKD